VHRSFFAGAVYWAWATFDFWEAGPILGTALAVGILTGAALYSGTKIASRLYRVLLASILGGAAAIITIIVTFLVTGARWSA
jgi:hypothetical protein